MFNYNNLSDYEFEILCKDIMQKKLGKTLQIFARGRDGGIDITDDTISKNVVVQVKHYINSKYTDLLSSLKKETTKVKELNPNEYYVCCAVKLTPGNKTEIFDLFSNYMKGSGNILSLSDIEEYLQEPENMDIVRKHYKLWLESTKILSQIINGDIFIDCETFFYNIEKDKNKFVTTSSYEQCIKVLEHERLLMILGMPGTGKTMTTKMLALHYAANGYRLIYTTNGKLASIKKSLSCDKESKEIILLDDCLGQYYFKMKDTQENELISLIKYVLMHKNKKLIMNSRVTIFNHAKETCIELDRFIGNEKVKIQYINMNSMRIEDKGKIFKNHLYFSDIPHEYYIKILENNNYRWIVTHTNYTPRIIDYVTRKGLCNEISADSYCDYIRECLDNPAEIWSDEYKHRLLAEDRIFLTSLFSLTDVSVDDSALRRVFNARISHRRDIDITRNVWEEVLQRLEGNFVKIIGNKGIRQIGVINPSVNDFLRNHLEKNELEVEEIRKNVTEYIQVERGFGPNMIDIVKNGKACDLNYSHNKERVLVVLSYVGKYEICMETYRKIVHEFLTSLSDMYGYMKDGISIFSVLPLLFSDSMVEYYDTYNILSRSVLEKLLSIIEFDDFCQLQQNLKEKGTELIDLIDINVLVSCLDCAMREYIDSLDRAEYYWECDLYELFNSNMIYDGECSEVDVQKVVDIVTDTTQENMYIDIKDKLDVFPESVKDAMDFSPYNIEIDKEDIESYVYDTLNDPGERDYGDFYDDYESYSDHSRQMDELDFIFAE